MKKIMWLTILFPILLIAQEVVVPDMVADGIETTVDGFITKTWILSSAVMAIYTKCFT